jgi:hypothetical protein
LEKVLNVLENIHVNCAMERRLWGVEFPSPVFKYGMTDTQVLSDVDETQI